MDFQEPISVDRPDVGQWETFTMCPVFTDGSSPHPAGGPGKYRVEFVLGITIFHIDNMHIGFEAEGDSFIQFRNPEMNLATEVKEIHISAIGPGGEVGTARITCNERGRMSKIIFDEIDAQNRFEAEKLAYLLVSPLISWISFAYDVPIHVVQINTRELSTGLAATTAWISPKVKGLDSKFEPPSIPHSPRLLECIGQYREGISTTNEFYSFLCFWKAFEGAEYIRRKLDKYVSSKHISGLPPRDLIIPDVPEVRNCYPDFVGKRIGYVQDKFKKKKRDAIAHLDTNTGTYASVHSLDALNDVRTAIPVIRLVAKMAINNELRIYGELIRQGHTQIQL